jgi:hypothetical protein
MIDGFGALILTHRRPHNQMTLSSLRSYGYSGPVYLVVDDEDPTLPEYQALYPDQVIVFSKSEGRSITDDADNTGAGRGVVYARNMCHSIASKLGWKYFVELDDDYYQWKIRFNSNLEYGWYDGNLTEVFRAMVSFLDSDDRILSVAMSQGGDHIGGGTSSYNKKGPIALRKAMNVFICRTDRPFSFYGRINEDTTAYVTLGRRGSLFFTVMQAQVTQLDTQENPGGLTEIYLDTGTYYKSFLSVMWEPSCVKISAMGSPTAGHDGHWRIHHHVEWRYAVPKIISARHMKPDPMEAP